MSAPSTPDVYTDFTAFTRMRADARAGGDTHAAKWKWGV